MYKRQTEKSTRYVRFDEGTLVTLEVPKRDDAPAALAQELLDAAQHWCRYARAEVITSAEVSCGDASDHCMVIADVRIATAVALPRLDRADVRVELRLRNATARPVRATVRGTVAGVALRRVVRIGARRSVRVAFGPGTVPGLALAHPRLWWPHDLGEPALHDLALAVDVAGAESDVAARRFGIRDVRSRLDARGHRVFSVNGRDVRIRAGGWAGDILLRQDGTGTARQVELARDAGLNALRLEGKLDGEALYAAADRVGVMLLPGWMCCDRFEQSGDFAPAEVRADAPRRLGVLRHGHDGVDAHPPQQGRDAARVLLVHGDHQARGVRVRAADLHEALVAQPQDVRHPFAVHRQGGAQALRRPGGVQVVGERRGRRGAVGRDPLHLAVDAGEVHGAHDAAGVQRVLVAELDAKPHIAFDVPQPDVHLGLAKPSQHHQEPKRTLRD